MERSEIEQNIQEFEVREVTSARLKKAGLPVPLRPPDTADGVDLFTTWEKLKAKYGGLANIPFSELGDYLDGWTQLVSYARWVEAVADIDQATAREIRDTVKKQLYVLQEGNREMRDALVYTEKMYLEWEKKYTENLALYIATQALREGYERRADAISREITRRSSDVMNTRRGMNRGNAG